MMAMPSSLQVAITEPWMCMSSVVVEIKGMPMLTIFCFLLVRLKAHFDLDRRDGHYLIRTHKQLVSTGMATRGLPCVHDV